MYKSTNKYADKHYTPQKTDLAKTRLEKHNEKIRAKRKMLEDARSKGSLDKAMISKIYNK